MTSVSRPARLRSVVNRVCAGERLETVDTRTREAFMTIWMCTGDLVRGCHTPSAD